MLKKMMEKRNQKGFTLMEMLIVVAIIAILVAIAIPVFTSQLEKAREATDAANIRAAYAEVMMAYLAGGTPDTELGVTAGDGGSYSKDVTLQQKKANWQTTDIKNNGIAGIKGDKLGTPQPNGKATVKVDAEGKASIDCGGASGGGSQS